MDVNLICIGIHLRIFTIFKKGNSFCPSCLHFFKGSTPTGNNLFPGVLFSFFEELTAINQEAKTKWQSCLMYPFTLKRDFTVLNKI